MPADYLGGIANVTDCDGICCVSLAATYLHQAQLSDARHNWRLGSASEPADTQLDRGNCSRLYEVNISASAMDRLRGSDASVSARAGSGQQRLGSHTAKLLQQVLQTRDVETVAVQMILKGNISLHIV
jgi:hypothetical protein